MSTKIIKKRKKYERRVRRTRSKIVGTTERPRLTVHKSLKHVYAQLIDDSEGQTLAFASTLSPQAKGQFEEKDNKSGKGFKVGQLLAQIAKEKGIENAVFDRQGGRYHGRVKAVADGARKGGLNF